MDSKEFEKLMLCFAQAKSAKDIDAIAPNGADMTDEQRTIFTALYEARLKDVLQRSDELMRVAKFRMSLQPVTDYVSMSYIASRFFGKSRSWLANKLNGRASALNDEERETLSNALRTMSQELGEAAARIA